LAEYKRISTKRGTRHVKVLASGQYRFVSKKAYDAAKGTKSSSSKKTKKIKNPKRGKSMAKRKNKNRKKVKRKLSISGMATIATTLLASPAPGWSSAYDKIQAGKFPEAGQSALASLTGIKIGGIGGQVNTEIPWQKIINPFDMAVAPALKVFFWSKILMKIIRRVAGNPIAGIPMLPDYVRFS